MIQAVCPSFRPSQLDWRSRLARFVGGDAPLAIWPGCGDRFKPLDPLREDVRAALAEAERWRDAFEIASITRNLSFSAPSRLASRLVPFGQALQWVVRRPVSYIHTLVMQTAAGTARDFRDGR